MKKTANGGKKRAKKAWAAALAALTAALFGVSATGNAIFAQEIAQTTQNAETSETGENGEDSEVGEDSEIEEDGETAELSAAEAALDAYSAGNCDLAYRLMKGVYDANPDSDPPGVFLAFLHSNGERFLEMRRALEQTAEDYPDDPEAFLQLAGVDVREGRYLEAELLLERVERLNDGYAARFPNSTRLVYLREEALSVRALLAERRGRYDAAAELTRKILDANPNNAQARWNAGYLAIKRNRLDEAESAFDALALLDERYWPGWLQVATTLDSEDRLDEAFERLQAQPAALEVASRRERAQLARLYMRWGKLDEAAALVDELEKEGKNDFDGWALRGWVALYAGAYPIAEEAFRKAFLLDGTSFEASNGLALALLDQRNKEKLAQARTLAAKNYRAYPNSPDAAATYAWTLFLSGSTREADAIFGPALESGEFSATVAYYLAEIANLRGDRSLAKTLLDLALNQKSNFPKRAAALELREIIAPTAKKESAEPEKSPENAETSENAEPEKSPENVETSENAEPEK